MAAKFDATIEEDPQRASHEELLQMWQMIFQDEPVRVSRLRESRSYTEFQDEWSRLDNALRTLAEVPRLAELSMQKVGLVLKKFEHRPAGGLKLVSSRDSSTKSNIWRVVSSS
ncbi:hypothetical protein [Magnetococcus sp. PR-3]|uniref:hypothetical protein n=1 Tax=Magnetococcus sp. PR-3 TaxID=3120355 RepID=UPI002FCDE739